MQDEAAGLRDEAAAAIRGAQTQGDLEAARVEFLGRKGKLSALRKGLSTLPPEEKPAAGKLLNEITAELQALFELRQAEIAARAAAEALAAERLDVTLPGRAPRVGRPHPLLATMHEMVDVFLRMGFAVAEGPEIEDYYHGFEALNYPPDHPAMDEQMTFYVDGDSHLRSQTSTVQIRYMETHAPPVRIVFPGRCYRRDKVDATHNHTFYQFEGLLVDEDVTFADLKGAMTAFAKAMFGEDMAVRLRPDFFPFTEPSAEFALTCLICRGEGCRVCSQTGWLEIGGSGMVDPNVLRAVGYDPERWTGWAFGFGIDRLAMLRHRVDDIRHLYQNDMRFLGAL